MKSRERTYRVLLILLAGACVGEAPGPAHRGLGGDGTARANRPVTRPATAPAAAVAEAPDTHDSKENRDPFRSYLHELVRDELPSDLPIIMPTVSVDQMRLIAVVRGTTRPKAMIRDPEGLGHVVEPGSWVGRPEAFVDGDLPFALTWRVLRVRENEIVLARQNPTRPDAPPTTKVLTLENGA